MTVIATVITRHCTAHASDSFLTREDGEVVESEASKLVRVEPLRGAFAFWGLGNYGAWNTLEWLKRRAESCRSSDSPAEFAEALAKDLTQELASRAMQNRHRGLGIHFTAYEYVDNQWVPELFLISNYEDETYSAVRSDGFRVTRETFGTITNSSERSKLDGDKERRLQVQSALMNSPLMLRYCNGDPTIYMPLAHAVLEAFIGLSCRSELKDRESSRVHRSIVSRPVELVSRLVSDFVVEHKRKIGGKTHNLSILPTGIFESSSGD